MNTDLLNKIHQLRKNENEDVKSSNIKGYGLAVVILVDLFSCILVGLGIGLFLQKFFHTSPLVTAGLTLLGGIAGFYSIVRLAIREEKRNLKK